MKSNKNKIICLIIALSFVLCTFSAINFSSSKYVTGSNGEYNLNLLVFDPEYKCIADSNGVATIPLLDMKPGISREYYFSVNNNKSDLVGYILPIEYSLNMVSYGNLPLVIKIYKNDVLVNELTHDHSNNNSIMQTYSKQKMVSSNGKYTDKYKISVVWDRNSAYYEYSYELEYLAIFCSAWQE